MDRQSVQSIAVFLAVTVLYVLLAAAGMAAQGHAGMTFLGIIGGVVLFFIAGVFIFAAIMIAFLALVWLVRSSEPV
jgi:Zn-dependent protease with chaperone function